MQGQKQKMVTIDWKPNRESKEPIYAQIVSYVSRRISSGDWGSGQTLPSQRKLSEIFGVNRSTIVEAMDEPSDSSRAATAAERASPAAVGRC